MSNIPFDNTYARLPEQFYQHAQPATVPHPSIIRINEPLAQSLGIDPAWLASEEGCETIAGNRIEKGSEPLAQAYAGHQFGGFNPQLGDGRAILLGEVIAGNGNRYDIQLKGSGRTPYSRGGDGKSALGPALREYLLCEAMHALGVQTTRALAVASTGEEILRHDGMQPGGVFTRVASSHIRVGTFQYFAAQRDTESVRTLADFAIARHYPHCLDPSDESDDSTSRYIDFFKCVIKAQAELIAHWMSLGFIHGVMNTDNCAISGETIDYGPCAFIDSFHPDTVFSSIDRDGRYAWGNQASIGLWNMSRLAECLMTLFDDDHEQAQQIAEESLNSYSQVFNAAYHRRYHAKFCLPVTDPDTEEETKEAAKKLIQDGLSLLANQKVDYTLFFHHLTSYAGAQKAGNEESQASVESKNNLEALFEDKAHLSAWLKMWQQIADPTSCLAAMEQSNPTITPRNHQIEAVIQAAINGDYTPFHQLHQALSTPYQHNPANNHLAQPPQPHQIVTETFCGT